MYGYSTRETWPFECLHCHHIWAEEYAVRRVTDRRGTTTDVWLRDDVPVQPPPLATRCPSCQGTNLAAFPKGYLDHHPGLLSSGPAPDRAPWPGPASPEPVPAEPRGARSARARRRHALGVRTARTVCLAAIALAVLVVAVYEFYEIILAAPRLH